MFANGYVGTAEDAVRIRRQEKEREKQRKKFETLAAAKHDQAAAAGLRQFAATSAEALEHAFKNETVGLVTKADFVKKRTTIQDRMEEELRRKLAAEEEAVAAEKDKKRKAMMSLRAGKLSFAAGDEDEEEEDNGSGNGDDNLPAPTLTFKLPSATTTTASAPEHDQQATGPEAGPSTKSGGQNENGIRKNQQDVRPGSSSPEPEAKRLKKIGKDPNVVTDFLPDRERAKLEEQMRAQLKKEWQAAQDKIKGEQIAVVYSYWDGTGHRREIKVKKGDSIGQFLKSVKEQLVPDFRELRHVSVDNLMYVKEDIILPHHHTFYELIVNKARGKSGPLFDFGVHEDIRVINDASREKQESHAGKVVERHWYDRNKHIFPANRWEVFDPEKKYDSYSIYG